MFSLFIECGFYINISKELNMIILSILLLLLFRRECGILLMSISEFISNCLKQPTEVEDSGNYTTGTNGKPK